MSVSTTANRIRTVLERDFGSHIDMADLTGKPDDYRGKAFRSRALAALAVRSTFGVDVPKASSAVVDGYDDNGVDAVYFDPPGDTLLFVQAKWSENGNASFDEGSASKFVNGVKKLLAADFDTFGDKIKEKKGEICEALYSSRDIKIILMTIHTSKQPMAKHVRRILDNIIQELNDPVKISRHIDVDLAGVYERITKDARLEKIQLQAVLNDWGMIDRPYLSYYGRVALEQVAGWWEQHGDKLFSQNLRLFYHTSSVNDAIRSTISDKPQNFWYYNNGITIIADKVIKGIAGSPAHKFGNFTCDGASVVNGAQTVGSIGTSFDAKASVEDPDRPEWVQVRLISLENCPPDFARQITRAANLQNAVGNREFAAMDPAQHRLAVEFALDRRRYVYKSGDADPRGEEGCSIVEATLALACAHSVRLAVEVKREIGSLWADTDRQPYTDIFPAEISTDRVWRSVKVLRTVDDELQRLRASSQPRADLVATHLNRIILHIAFQKQDIQKYVGGAIKIEEDVNIVKDVVPDIFEKVSDYINWYHTNDYLANFSKNITKCEKLVIGLNRPTPANSNEEDYGDLLSRMDPK